MGLKENTNYDYGSTMQSITKGAANFNKSLPKFNSAQYSNLRQTVTGPSSGGNVAGATVTTPYGGSTQYEQFHPGIDVAKGMGTNLSSFTPGVVQEVVTGKRQGDPGFGNYVVITDSEGNKLRYSHLQNAFVKVGQTVNRGDVIGTEGNTGQTYSMSGGTGSHLDFRVKDIYGKYINPNRFISS